ncbi:MAG: cytochrome c3 family protein, partial [Myxococcaceae bacterium]
MGWLVSASAFAQIFSPGPLARAHQDLEGLANCTACHPAGSKLSAEACESCHKEIQTRIQKKSGFHGRLTLEQKAECWSCHHDHQGKNFDMLDWGEGGKLKFPHDRTGWPLEGKHREVKCEDCHQKRFIEDSAVIAMLKAQVGRFSWLGVPPRCSNCHFDEHRHQLPDTCETCHTPKGWAPAPKFDHDKSRYPLKGAHKKVECKDCHKQEKDEETPAGVIPKPVNPEAFARYKPVPHNSCLSCHEDPHKGRFGQRCESCHTLNNWKEVKNVPASANGFDHSKTRYPLEGLHARVECHSCHGPFPGKPAKYKNMAFKECTDCHFDAHENQLASSSRGLNPGPLCNSCHTVEGFIPVRFTLDQHEKTKYPLKDAHRAVACNACHTQETTLVKKVPQAIVRFLADTKRPLLVSLAVFDIPRASDTCETCHEDIHAGQFEAKKKPCEKCHVVKGFKQLSFDHNRDSVFELSGAHVKTACGS